MDLQLARMWGIPRTAYLIQSMEFFIYTALSRALTKRTRWKESPG